MNEKTIILEAMKKAGEPLILGDTVRVGVISAVTPHWKKACAGTDRPGANHWGDMERIRRAKEVVHY